eukprot:m.1226872 g.1226872  ORF g.1226872 m.1226872 type:complete len:502 (+) comp24640_c0_seq7:138-1643(+)
MVFPTYLKRCVLSNIQRSPEIILANVCQQSRATTKNSNLLHSKYLDQDSDFDPITRPPKAAYIHIPFCRQRCHYCSFAIIPLSTTRKIATEVINERLERLQHRYANVITDEMEATADAMEYHMESQYVRKEPLETVYFGGGTPSLMEPEVLDQILDTLRRRFGLASDAEVTIEMDPGTFNAAKLNAYVALGITRVSVGVQSFDDAMLTICNRSHSRTDVLAALESVTRCAGLASWSLDLICGLPTQCLEHWKETLAEALTYSPPHLAVYNLGIEPNTRFSRKYEAGISPLPSEDDVVDMYTHTRATLVAAGYEHYEIMNYARSNHDRSRHNQVYWDNRAYHGFGLGATSYLFGKRFSRPRSGGGYAKWVGDVAQAVRATPPHSFALDVLGAAEAPWKGGELPADLLQDTIILGLRRKEGLDLHKIARIFGKEPAESIETACSPFRNAGLVRFVYASGNQAHDTARVVARTEWPWVQLIDPEGFLRENLVLAAILADVDRFC